MDLFRLSVRLFEEPHLFGEIVTGDEDLGLPVKPRSKTPNF
jgi:hypothetical protein